MTVRITACIIAAVFLLSANHASCGQEPLTLKLTYKTVHGGLKTAVSPTIGALPRLGLALAGGGARAAAALGVLKVLNEEGIPVSCIAGTSMGAGVGGMYAAGYSPDEIEDIFLANDWNSIFTDTPLRAFLTQEQKEAGSRYLLEFTFHRGRFRPPSGLTAGQKLMNLLAAKTLAASFEADLDFDRLPVPFRAVATDIENGDTVILGRGLLHEAIRASMAIPLVFQPVEFQGRLLVDGGLVNNLPVDVVRTMGAEIVIAVDSSEKLERKEKLTSLLGIMGQSISLQIRRESERQASLADLVIMPDTSQFGFTDFPQIPAIIKKGEEAARAALPRIREILKAKRRLPHDENRFHITSLVVRGNSLISDAAIRSAMANALPTRETTKDEILAAVSDVFRLGWFSDVSIDLEKEGERTRAILTVAENPVVRSVDLSGNTIVATPDFLSTISWQLGQPLNTTRLEQELDGIVKRCRSGGYLLTRVERAGMKSDGSTLEIVLYEGRVDSITIMGQRRTERSLIQRETVTRPGKPLNFDSAARDIQHLYALDYFESLTVDMARSPQGGVDLTLKIKEKPTTKVRLGLRYDLEDRFTGLTDIIVDNVTGRGIKTYLTMRYGNYTDLTLGYHSPVIINTYFVHTVQAFYRERHYFIYDNKQRISELDIIRTGSELAFGYQWFRFGDTYLRYRYAVDSRKETLGVSPPTERTRIGSFAFLTTVDTRDTSVFPHAGGVYKASYEAAEPDYGSSNAFTKAQLFAQQYVPLADRHTLILEGSAGLGSGIMPYEEQFGIGGSDYLISIPLLGYQRREFTGRDELGFSATYRWKIRDYQLKAIRALYLQVAGQAANVWDDSSAMSLHHLRNGAGIGLHADSIIGPVRLDYGVGEQHRYTVYFSAGFDF